MGFSRIDGLLNATKGACFLVFKSTKEVPTMQRLGKSPMLSLATIVCTNSFSFAFYIYNHRVYNFCGVRTQKLLLMQQDYISASIQLPMLNKNVAEYTDFEGKTNKKIIQAPGGTSSISLAWGDQTSFKPSSNASTHLNHGSKTNFYQNLLHSDVNHSSYQNIYRNPLSHDVNPNPHQNVSQNQFDKPYQRPHDDQSLRVMEPEPVNFSNKQWDVIDEVRPKKRAEGLKIGGGYGYSRFTGRLHQKALRPCESEKNPENAGVNINGLCEASRNKIDEEPKKIENTSKVDLNRFILPTQPVFTGPKPSSGASAMPKEKGKVKSVPMQDSQLKFAQRDQLDIEIKHRGKKQQLPHQKISKKPQPGINQKPENAYKVRSCIKMSTAPKNHMIFGDPNYNYWKNEEVPDQQVKSIENQYIFGRRKEQKDEVVKYDNSRSPPGGKQNFTFQ